MKRALPRSDKPSQPASGNRNLRYLLIFSLISKIELLDESKCDVCCHQNISN